MDCSLPGSSVHRILQTRIVEWIATPFSRGSSCPRDQTQVSCIVGIFFIIWATRGVRLFAVRFWAGVTWWKLYLTISLKLHIANKIVFCLIFFFSEQIKFYRRRVMKSLSLVWLFATPWTPQVTVHVGNSPWSFSGNSTGVGCHFLLQGIFLTQGSDLGLLYCRQMLYHLSHREALNKGLL